MSEKYLKTINELEKNYKIIGLNILNTLNLSTVERIDIYLYYESKKTIFNTYWLEARNETDEKTFFDFLIYFFTIQNKGEMIHPNKLYENFEKFYKTYKKIGMEEKAFRELCKYLKYYIKIINSNVCSGKIDECLKKINDFNIPEVYPYLMQIMEDYEYALINNEIFVEILELVIGYINQRYTDKKSKIITTFNELSEEINNILDLKLYTPKIVTLDNGELKKEYKKVKSR